MSSRFEDSRLDDLMEQYKQQILQFQRATRQGDDRPRYEDTVKLAPVDYNEMTDEEIFNQPAVMVKSDFPAEAASAAQEAIVGAVEAVVGAAEAVAGAEQAIAGAEIAEATGVPEAVAGAEEAFEGAEETIAGAIEAVAGAREAVAGAKEIMAAQKAPELVAAEVVVAEPRLMPAPPRVPAEGILLAQAIAGAVGSAIGAMEVAASAQEAEPKAVVDARNLVIGEPVRTKDGVLLAQAVADAVESAEQALRDAVRDAADENRRYAAITEKAQRLADAARTRAAEAEIVREERESLGVNAEEYLAAMKEAQSKSPPLGNFVDSNVSFYDILSQNTAPRLMFAKGCGAFGALRPYQSFGEVCAAPFLAKQEPMGVFARFSSDVLNGDADARRCMRGLALRIYDGEKLYDLPFTSMPTTPVKNPDLIPKFIKAQRPNKLGLRDNASLWQFVLEHPEALQGMLMLSSDLGTPSSYRTINYYSMPMYLVDKNGVRRLAKLRLSPRSAGNPLTRFEAEELCGCDPDALTRDLAVALGKKEGVVFELSAQVVDEELMSDLEFDPLDPTVLWRLSRFPIITLGEVVFNSPVTDHNAQTERFTLGFDLPVGMEYPENSIWAKMSQLVPEAQLYRTGEERKSEPRLYAANPWNKTENQETGIERVGQWLDQMSQRERKRLIENLADEFSDFEADLLEQVLMLLTKAELPFGKALTLALEGA